jgi:integrase
MSNRVAGALERHFQQSAFQADGDLVFAHPQTGWFYDPSKMRRRFYSALQQAKVGRLRFHDLRHTFGTRMAASGVPMRTLQEWMGHRNLQTTEIYAHYAPQAHEQQWVERAFGGQAQDAASPDTDGLAAPEPDGKEDRP